MTAAAVLSYHVTAYAAQVRAHLGDLSREQLEDLTDGLEADLMEAWEDPEARPVTGEIPLAGAGTEPAPGAAPPDGASYIDLTERFGTPRAYAEELRAAAGLPAPWAVTMVKPVRPPLVYRTRARLRALRARLEAQPWWPAARAVGEVLRPLWWVVRGWVLFNIVVTMVSGTIYFLPKNLFAILLLLAAVAVSIQHGQGRWTLAGRGGQVLSFVSVVAAVGLLPVLMTASSNSSRVEYMDNGYYYAPEPPADGVYFGGLPVTNLFVYDAEGNFIDQAQIFDDKGRPVRVDRDGGLWDESNGTSRFWSSAQDTYGRQIWNSFPLRMWSDQDGEWDNETQSWVLPEGVTPKSAPPPFVQVAPLATEQGAADPGAPTDSPTDSPTTPADPAAGDGEGDPADPAAPADPGVANPTPADPGAPEAGETPPAG